MTKIHSSVVRGTHSFMEKNSDRCPTLSQTPLQDLRGQHGPEDKVQTHPQANSPPTIPWSRRVPVTRSHQCRGGDACVRNSAAGESGLELRLEVGVGRAFWAEATACAKP